MKPTIEHVSLDKATTPCNGEVLVDRWWAHDPDRGLLFARFPSGHLAPQCNKDKRITESIISKLYPNAESIHVPVVYVGPGVTREEGDDASS